MHFGKRYRREEITLNSPRAERASESAIEQWLNRQVKAAGGVSYKFVSPGNRGVPDRIYLLPGGDVWFVELKAEGGQRTALQEQQARRIQKTGCRYRLITGMDEARAFAREVILAGTERGGGC